MKRILILSLVLLALTPSGQSESDLCAVNVLVGEHKNLAVIVPCMNRQQLVELVSSFFGGGDEAAKNKFERVLSDAGEVSLTLSTTKRSGEHR